jgi:membrane protein DedA with SNARE-associated domain
MPIWKFATLTTIGSASWNLIWISIGKSLGDKWESAESWAKLFDYVVYFGILILLIWFLQSRKNRQT